MDLFYTIDLRITFDINRDIDEKIQFLKGCQTYVATLRKNNKSRYYITYFEKQKLADIQLYDKALRHLSGSFFTTKLECSIKDFESIVHVFNGEGQMAHIVKVVCPSKPASNLVEAVAKLNELKKMGAEYNQSFPFFVSGTPINYRFSDKLFRIGPYLLQEGDTKPEPAPTPAKQAIKYTFVELPRKSDYLEKPNPYKIKEKKDQSLKKLLAETVAAFILERPVERAKSASPESLSLEESSSSPMESTFLHSPSSPLGPQIVDISPIASSPPKKSLSPEPMETTPVQAHAQQKRQTIQPDLQQALSQSSFPDLNPILLYFYSPLFPGVRHVAELPGLLNIHNIRHQPPTVEITGLIYKGSNGPDPKHPKIQ